MQANLWELLVTQVLGTISYTTASQVSTPEKVRNKVHSYQFADMGLEFVLEPATENHGYSLMTAQRFGVRSGDRIAFHDEAGTTEYRVSDIEYYSDPPDMWIAKLRAYTP
jgi:hypothetical protein